MESIRGILVYGLFSPITGSEFEVKSCKISGKGGSPYHVSRSVPEAGIGLVGMLLLPGPIASSV